MCNNITRCSGDGLRLNALLRSVASHAMIPDTTSMGFRRVAFPGSGIIISVDRSAQWEPQGARRRACALVVHGGSLGREAPTTLYPLL